MKKILKVCGGNGWQAGGRCKVLGIRSWILGNLRILEEKGAEVKQSLDVLFCQLLYQGLSKCQAIFIYLF